MSDQTAQSNNIDQIGSISRRGLLRAAGAGAAAVGVGGLLQACSSGIKGANSGSGGGGTKAITIGWIHPLTGALAGFGAPDNWVISKIKQTTPYKSGFKIGSKTYAVTIKSYDTQSSPTRAGDLAKTAILNDDVDLLLASSTPETVNAVASQAESLGTPLICSNIPWESWYLNLFPKGNPEHATEKAKYVVMYFLGAEHLAKCFIPMWDRIHAQLHTNKMVAAAFPNDSDGNAFRAVFPPIAHGGGLQDGPVVGLPRRDHELLLDDLPVQVGQGRLLHQRAAAARLRHHVEAVGPAGLQAEAGHRGQGAAVPARRLRAGEPGVQHRHRRLVGAVAAVEVLVHRGDLPAAGRTTSRPRPRGSGTPTSATTASSRPPTRPSPR